MSYSKVRSKADITQLNLQHKKTKSKNRSKLNGNILGVRGVTPDYDRPT